MMSLVDNLNVIFAFLFGALSGLFVSILRVDHVLKEWKKSEEEWCVLNKQVSGALEEQIKSHCADVIATTSAMRYVLGLNKLSDEEVTKLKAIFQGKADYDLPTQTG